MRADAGAALQAHVELARELAGDTAEQLGDIAGVACMREPRDPIHRDQTADRTANSGSV
jgi:hypothetical protein